MRKKGRSFFHFGVKKFTKFFGEDKKIEIEFYQLGYYVVAEKPSNELSSERH